MIEADPAIEIRREEITSLEILLANPHAIVIVASGPVDIERSRAGYRTHHGRGALVLL